VQQDSPDPHRSVKPNVSKPTPKRRLFRVCRRCSSVLILGSMPWFAWSGSVPALPSVSGINFRSGNGQSQWNSGFAKRAGVAQLVEHLICNQRVGGSNPFASSTRRIESGAENGNAFLDRRRRCKDAGPVLCGDPTEVHAPTSRRFSGWGSMRGCGSAPQAIWGSGDRISSLGYGTGSWAQVAEWLMAADCKSAALWSYGGSNPPLCTIV
jgi:hypothetical protein